MVLPLASVLPQFGPLPEPALAALLGLTTVATTLNINGAELFNAALLTVSWDPAAVTEALPGTAAFLAILGECLSGWQALSSALLPPPVWYRCCRVPYRQAARSLPTSLCMLRPCWAALTRRKRNCVPAHHLGLLYGCCRAMTSLPSVNNAAATIGCHMLPSSPAAALHELGHRLAAGKRGVELAPPLFIPAGLGLLGRWGLYGLRSLPLGLAAAASLDYS